MKLPAYKVTLFFHCIGVDSLNGFQFDSVDDKNDPAKIIQKFDEFTIGELNETFERYTFNSRKTKALMFMSLPFAHSRKHIIFVTACVIRSFATGSS